MEPVTDHLDQDLLRLRPPVEDTLEGQPHDAVVVADQQKIAIAITRVACLAGVVGAGVALDHQGAPDQQIDPTDPTDVGLRNYRHSAPLEEVPHPGLGAGVSASIERTFAFAPGAAYHPYPTLLSRPVVTSF